MRLIKTLFGRDRTAQAPSQFSAPTRPDRPLYVIGDIHGRADLLDQMMDRLHEMREPTSDLVFVGDIIDRGDDSDRTIAQVHSVVADPANRATCLLGNHEKMLLQFLDQPLERGRRWLQFGGLQTLMSFGLRGVTERATDEVLLDARDEFAATLGLEAQSWLRQLPLHFDSGNISVVHAAADPEQAIAQQPDKVLLWGHPKFTQIPRTDGRWIVHGHTITDQANAVAGRINVDTGAFATGRLSGARITGDGVAFFSVGT